jgi:hypothetical protein
LAPKLKTFGLSENSVNINVFTSDKPGDTITPENDLIVIYGYGDTPGWNGIHTRWNYRPGSAAHP